MIEEFPTAHRVTKVHHPTIFFVDVTHRGSGSTFCHNRMSFTKERFADNRDREPRLTCFNCCTQSGSTCTDNDAFPGRWSACRRLRASAKPGSYAEVWRTPVGTLLVAAYVTSPSIQYVTNSGPGPSRPNDDRPVPGSTASCCRPDRSIRPDHRRSMPAGSAPCASRSDRRCALAAPAQRSIA